MFLLLVRDLNFLITFLIADFGIKGGERESDDTTGIT